MLWYLHPCVLMSSSSNRQLIRLHFTQIPNIVGTWLSWMLTAGSLCTDMVRACCNLVKRNPVFLTAVLWGASRVVVTQTFTQDILRFKCEFKLWSHFQ